MTNFDEVAKLANIKFNEQEKITLFPQLNKIISFVSKLNEADTSNTVPTSQVTGKVNELREDNPEECLSTKEAISNAPKTKTGYIVTKAVFDV